MAVLYVESRNNCFNAPRMNMRIVVNVIQNIFGVRRVIVIRRVKVGFKERVDYIVPDVIAVTAIIFMLNRKSFPTPATGWDGRRWPISISTLVERYHKLSESFAGHFHIVGQVAGWDVGKDHLNNFSGQGNKIH